MNWNGAQKACGPSPHQCLDTTVVLHQSAGEHTPKCPALIGPKGPRDDGFTPAFIHVHPHLQMRSVAPTCSWSFRLPQAARGLRGGRRESMNWMSREVGRLPSPCLAPTGQCRSQFLSARRIRVLDQRTECLAVQPIAGRHRRVAESRRFRLWRCREVPRGPQRLFG